MGKIKIYIADDYPVLRDGIKAVFASQPGFDVVGEAGDGVEALEGIARLKPDIVIMDITMPRLNGITATKRIVEDHPAVKVIMLSMHTDINNAIDAFRAVARGYILKDSPSEDILEAVSKVNEGAKYASPAVAAGLLDGFVEIIKKDQLDDPFDTLSQREREVLSATTDEISRSMDSISDIAKSNVTSIGEVSRATGEMARLATELKDLVGRFTIDEHSSRSDRPTGTEFKVVSGQFNPQEQPHGAGEARSAEG